ncbi:unnamed protein product [Cladocopium goreaui]|uniref:DUF7869 domain-containing protein n=1 Tax=Cladocopium goreaui TaxID=2562237 RepID=A0A9P1CBR1_9DINO|nr:unnamed protein product [Cladocopium goreaui]
MTFPRMPARGFRKKVSMYRRSQSSNDPGYLANLIRSKCGCKARCFSTFTSNPNHLESWKRMRVTLAGMTKLEKDQHVFQVLKNQDQETCRGSRHLRFLGNPVCNRGFMKLFGHEMLQRHLRRQLRDRQLYWGARAVSRLRDLTTVFLNVQADNCCKEVKNNGTIRFLAMKTALHCLGGAEVNFLTSGHSHEDIDALFSVIGSEIESCKELWTPQDFQQCLEKFMQNTQVRPYEPQRRVDQAVDERCRMAAKGLSFPSSLRGAKSDHPFDMPSAAEQLENVSYGILDPCTIDVSWWGSQVLQVSPCLKHSRWLKCSRIHLLRALPHLGPAVGRPADPVVQGQSLEAVRT